LAEFVRWVLSEARTGVADGNRGEPEVDWDSIWSAGDGAPSEESAIGRIVRAASEAARGIAVDRPEVVPPPPKIAAPDGVEAPRGAVLPRPPETRDDLGVLAGPLALPVEPVALPPEPLVMPHETAGVDPELTSTIPEPLTEPVVTAPSATDASTVAGPETPATTEAEPVHADDESSGTGRVTALPEALLIPAAMAPVGVEPVSTITEPVTEPMVTTPGPVDSLTVARPETPVTTEAAAVLTDDVAVVTAAPLGDDVTAGPPEQVAGTRREAPRHSAWYHVFTWMRNVGLIVLLFVVWQLWGTDIAQHHAQSQLKNQFDAAVQAHHVPAEAGNGKGLIPAATRFAPAADGSVIARLQIPAIGVDQYVVEGTTADDLSKGPGHYIGTAYPGQAGNVAIAGHRTTHGAPFNELGHLVAGNRIVLTTTWGENLTYIVSGTPQAVSPDDVAVLNYFGDNRITLTTCNPEFSSSQRLIVVGKLRQPLGTHLVMPAHLVYHVADTGTANWNWSLLPAVGVEICLLLLLALSYRLFEGWFGSGRRWLILVPLWAAGLYLLFGSLTSFLPSSI
jgi:LPXTG-site transpeptidase (sortase) family protein